MERKQAQALHEALVVEQGAGRPARLNFSNPAQREAHIQAFLSWLPSALKSAPGIPWDHLPSQVMGYLIRVVADHPDAVPITLAIGCAAMTPKTLYHACYALRNLLHQLRTQYGMTELAQLRERDIWDHFVAGRILRRGEVEWLTYYDGLASLHLPAYFEGLAPRLRLLWEPVRLPPLPTGFIKKSGVRRAVIATSERRRKEQSDVLVPLFPLLVELAQLRKQAAERLIKAIRELQQCVLAGKIELPYRFQYTDLMLSVPADAATVADVKLIERKVTLSLTLWDHMSWMREHVELYSRSRRSFWKARSGPYAPEHNAFFIQYEGSPGDLLWFGDLVTKRLLEFHQKGGLTVSRPGLLTPPKAQSMWLTSARQRSGAILFEPESLYRGVLFATALAALALTNGSRANELLQISATRFETMVVDELKNQHPTGRKIGILVQHLLPKGCRHESERQFFLISDMAARLLREIGELLQARYGGHIPIVHPHHQNKKAHDLAPEPYFFQWAASSDGRLGHLILQDIPALLRFLFHGLTLTTRTGEPIRVVTHLLRHVLATHARQVKNVPAEAVAYLLHHRVTLPDRPQALTIPEATAYYSRMPVTQLLALLFEVQATLLSEQARSYLQVPSPRTLEHSDETLREIFEQWGMIGPTVFGYCSAGLCVRPDNRALCLGCPFLVPHYSNLPKAKTWRQLYVLQAQLHEEHGHHIDAQQARRAIQYLDDLIAMMQIQIRTRQDGGYLPFADTLPPTQDEEGEAS